MLRRMLRKARPIAWRDARIAELQAKVRSQEQRLKRLRQQQESPPAPAAPSSEPEYRPTVASWYARVMEQQRVQRAANALDRSAAHPRRNLFDKLHNYELARSLGVATPQVLGIWPEVEDIDWRELPERFVLKSAGGSTGRGVLPLERVGDSFRLVTGDRVSTPDEIVQHFRQAKGVRPPYFAEALLPGSDEVLPDDVKIYAFYGVVAFVMIRRMPRHADTSQARLRVLGPTGDDLGVVQRGRRLDVSIPVPPQLPLMVETAAALSLAVPLPFIRVDLYGSGDTGVLLGELTPLPGDSRTFTRAWDHTLGEMYDAAEARLQVDLATGRPYDVLHGPYDRTLSTLVPPTTRAPEAPLLCDPSEDRQLG